MAYHNGQITITIGIFLTFFLTFLIDTKPLFSSISIKQHFFRSFDRQKLYRQKCQYFIGPTQVSMQRKKPQEIHYPLISETVVTVVSLYFERFGRETLFQLRLLIQRCVRFFYQSFESLGYTYEKNEQLLKSFQFKTNKIKTDEPCKEILINIFNNLCRFRI